MVAISVTPRALRMPGVAARALAAHDRGEAAGGCAVRGLLGGGGLKSTQEPLRTPQSPRRKGMIRQCHWSMVFKSCSQIPV